MKISRLHIYLIILVIITVTIIKLNLPIYITYYGYLSKISNSGETRFRFTGSDLNNQYAWFWAMPADVPSDREATDKWIKYLQGNQEATFKITGTKGEDDCDYYGPDHCIENIDEKKIEAINK